MTLTNLLKVLFVVVSLSIGQVLFKLAAARLPASKQLNLDFVVSLATNVPLLVALVLYGGTTILWVMILNDVPLSRAYPLMSLTMVIVPLVSIALFNERFSPSLLIGIAFIIVGLIFTTRS